MKLITVLFILISLCAYSNPNTSARTKSIINKIQKQKFEKTASNGFLEIGSKELIPVLAVLKSEYVNTHNLETKYKIGSRFSKYLTMYVQPEQLLELAELEQLESFEITEQSGEPEIFGAANDAKVHLVHAGLEMPTNYTGKGVIVGIIDGGFDYTHPNFYDSTLQNYRVLAAWDQRTEGSPPDGYAIGSAYIGKDELLSAKRDTEEIQEHWGTHGTHVGGIAGGSGGGTDAKGVAYESQFIFCTKIDGDAGLFDAFNWMSEVAESEGKRLVINMSFGGLHSGTRDGTNPLGELMKELRDNKGVIFVGSAGNNGNNTFHLMQDFASDTLKTWVRPSSINLWGSRIIALGEIGKPFKVNLRYRDNSDFLNVINETSFKSTSEDDLEIDSFMVSETQADTLFYRMVLDASDPFSKRPRADIYIKNQSAHKVSLELTADEGLVHLWNVDQRDLNHTTNRGGRFARFGTMEDFTAGDAAYGLGEPGLNDAVITVAAHNHADGRLTSFSSEGPRIDGLIKPDISAPGQNVISSIANFSRTDYAQTVSTEFNGETYTFAGLSGTSMSGPLTAGVCALILEAKPDITGKELKALIKATANQDSFTGEISDEGSVEWGAGKVDAFSAILEVLGIINNIEINTENNLLLYPNPAIGKLQVMGLASGSTFNILDIDGRVVQTGIYNGEINIADLNTGSYFLNLENKSPVKFVVEK